MAFTSSCKTFGKGIAADFTKVIQVMRGRKSTRTIKIAARARKNCASTAWKSPVFYEFLKSWRVRNQQVVGSSPTSSSIFHSPNDCRWIKRARLFKSRFFLCNLEQKHTIYASFIRSKSWTKVFHFMTVFLPFLLSCQTWTDDIEFFSKKYKKIW